MAREVPAMPDALNRCPADGPNNGQSEMLKSVLEQVSTPGPKEAPKATATVQLSTAGALAELALGAPAEE
ncbi:uncharacterized protein N7459_003054 [Penicillium hispanicum]|uniref:uncharacterized protein n=1 Tax=Penicillium hispanicum TaxID=1080232 RepID=UPI0025406D26|nr:uncharacterized protein N7459_003054 [Penicillium hispanicum]KAJ5587289.1 hypothetical protein N7459_003054 [Penicillium hispanicum]